MPDKKKNPLLLGSGEWLFIRTMKVAFGLFCLAIIYTIYEITAFKGIVPDLPHIAPVHILVIFAPVMVAMVVALILCYVEPLLYPSGTLIETKDGKIKKILWTTSSPTVADMYPELYETYKACLCSLPTKKI
jgi:hypothetical protein